MKPTYSQSRINKWLRCPFSFKLSKEHKAKYGTSTMNLFREGNLFEGYVLGFKESMNEKELIGRKKPATIDPIKKQASVIAPIFEGQEGEPYKFLEYETEEYIARGELDYIGKINEFAFWNLTGLKPESETGRYIIDLKRTGDINRVWGEKETKEDFLQAAFYVYLNWKLTGDILPFIYVIVEDKYENPVVRTIQMEVTEDDLMWVQQLIDSVHNDIFFQADPCDKNCLGGYNKGRCPFLEHCTHGRKLAGGSYKLNFSALRSELS